MEQSKFKKKINKISAIAFFKTIDAAEIAALFACREFVMPKCSQILLQKFVEKFS
jgi:hypothetical protein